MKHCPSALFIPGVCVQTSKQQYRTSTSKYTCTISHQSETPVTATMSGAKFSRRYEETFFYSGLARGNTHFPRTWCLAGGAPTFRAPQSRPKSTPTSATGFREPPNKPAWPRQTPYTTVDVFPVDSVLFNPKYPARAGIPLRLGGLTPTFRTLTNAVWVLPKQAHKSLYSKHGSLVLLSVLLTYFPSFWNNTIHLIRSLIINIYRFPNIRRTIYMTSLYLINTIGLLYSRTRDRLPTFTCHRRARHQSGASHPQRHEVARQPWSTYCGP